MILITPKKMRIRSNTWKWLFYGIIFWCSVNNNLIAQTVTISPGGPTSFCKGGSVTLCAGGAMSYVWNVDSTTSCITVYKSGTYAVEGTLANGGKSSASVVVTVNACGVILTKTPSVSSIQQGTSTSVNFTYSVTNKGTLFNASGTVKDDNATPGNTADDVTICSYNSLAPGASISCTRSFIFNNTHTNVAIASGNTGGVLLSDTAVATVEGIACVVALSYPDNSNLPKSAVIFNENYILRASEPGLTNCATTGGVIKAWYNDEHAMTLGVRRVNIKTSSGITTTDYPVTPAPLTPTTVHYPLVGDTISSGNQSGNDVAAGGGRPLWPAIFITDLTVNGTTSRIGDWQQGGKGTPPHKVSGVWKYAVRLVDLTRSPAVVTVTPDPNPAKNNWNLGAEGDVPPGGFAALDNEGYGAACAWKVDDLGLIPSHRYRIQFMLHDGDQNKSGGDCGESYTTVYVPPCTVKAESILSDYNGSNVSCKGASNGSAGLIVNGGTAPYSYSWSGSDTTATRNNLGEGTYSYTVTDAKGCKLTDSVVIKAPAQLNASPALSNFQGTNVSCTNSTDGFINLAVTGGTAPYAYSWSVANRVAKNLNNIAAGNYNYSVTDANGCSVSNAVVLTAPNPLNAPSTISNFNGSNVSCMGATNGFINLSVSGGVGPYTYSWSQGSTTQNLSNIGAGTYNYTVTDNNRCSTSNSVTLLAPVAISSPTVLSNYNGSNVSCNGSTNGFINLSVSGGTAPYTYSWSPGGSTTQNLNNLGAGTYSFTVTDANNCTSSRAVTLVAPNPISVPVTVSNFNGSNVSCNGSTNGFINLSVSGGTGPYAYSWSPGGSTTQNLVNIGAGTYAYTVTDANGCTSSNSRTLLAPNPIASPNTVSNFNGSNVSCNGSTNGFINLAVSGGTAPYTYSWSPGGSTTQNLSNLGAGTYTYTLRDLNNCISSSAVTLIAPNPLAVPVTVSNFNGSNVSCSGSTNGFIHLNTSGGTGPYVYSWSPGGSTTQNLNNIGAGTYTYSVTDANGCSSSNSRTLTAPNPLTSPNTVSNFNGSNVSCNGSTNGFINLSVSGGTAPYAYSWSPGGSTTPNLNNIGAGTYTYSVTDANNCSSSGAITLIAPNLLSVPVTVSNFNGANVSCSGSTNGFIHLNTSGGTGPYTYSWSPGGSTTQNLNNIGAGTYAYTVTDANGCSSSNSRTLVAPNPVSAPTTVSNFNGSNVSCNGSTNGFINLTVTGGTAPYSYSWLPGGSTTQNLTNLGAGSYRYTVTDVNGCTKANTVVLLAPNPLNAPSTVSNYNGSNVSCNGTTNGFINLSVSGGTGPYSYAWSPGGSTTQNLTNLGAGTYSYTVTDLNGCLASNSITLSAPNPLNSPNTVSNFNGSNVSCSASTNGFINLAVSGGTGPYSYFWSPGGSTSQNLSNVGAGTYSYIVTDANGCTSSNSVTLSAPNPLNVPRVLSDFNGSNISCSGLTDGFIHLTANGGTGPYSYLWSPGGSTLQNRDSLGAGTYSYTVTDRNGCTVRDSVTLTTNNPINSPSVVSVYNESNVSCFGSTNGFIHLTTTGGTAPYSYLWSPGGNTTQNLNNIGAGTYSYTVTDANGCFVTNSVTLQAPNPIETPTVISNYGGSNVGCHGNTNGFINLLVTGGTGSYSYSWSPGGSTSQNLTNIGAGTYSYTVTDANGCAASNSITLTEPNPIDAISVVSNFNGSNVSCNGSTNGFINLTANGGTGAYSYNWSPTGSTSQNLSNIGAGTYVYTVTDINGCSYSSSVVLVQPNPLNALSVKSDYNGTGVSCSGSTNGYIHLTVSGGSIPYTYFWSPVVSTSPDLNNIGAGTYVYQVTDVNGCRARDSVTLTAPNPISSQQAVSINSGYNISCNGGSDGFIDATVTGGVGPYVYNWLPGNNSTQDLTNIGAGFFVLTVTDANGCADIDSIAMTEPDLLIVNGVATDALCFGVSNGSIAIAPVGGIPNYSYFWSTGATTQNVSGLGAGIHTVIITDANGCVTSNSFPIVQPNAIVSTLSSPLLNGNYNISCNGISDGSASAAGIGGTLPYSYLWSNGQTTPSITNLTAGAYSLIIRDVNGCSISNSITLSQPPPINVNAGLDQRVCGNSTMLQAGNFANGFTGTWSIQSGTAIISNLNDPHTAVTGLSYGSNVLQLFLTDGTCSATAVLSIEAFESVAAAAGPGDSICPKKAIGYQLNATPTILGSGKWKSDGTAAVLNPLNPHSEITGLVAGNNSFIWTVINGPCTASDEIIVYLRAQRDCYEGLEMPTAYTPNGDGVNDDFDIHGIERYPYNSLSVYNRWGNKVYFADNYVNHQWKGQNTQGEELPDATYFVILVIKDSEIKLHGYVDIRR